MNSHMKMERGFDGVRFQGEFRWDDWPTLDAVDRALLDECGRTDASAADWLLALEMLFRRASERGSAALPGAKE